MITFYVNLSLKTKQARVTYIAYHFFRVDMWMSVYEWTEGDPIALGVNGKTDLYSALVTDILLK